MNIDPLGDTAATDDLIAKTELDVRFALDTLASNIKSSMQEQVGHDFAELKDLVAGLPGQAQALSEVANTITALSDNIPLSQAIQHVEEVEDHVWGIVDMEGWAEDKRRKTVFRAGEISRFLNTAQSLDADLSQLAKEPAAEPLTAETPEQQLYGRLRNLLNLADTVGNYANVWTVYDKAWSQRRDHESDLASANEAGDAVIHSLYESFIQKDLRLKVPGQLLVTVFYENRLYTRVSTAPVLYVVAPIWGRHLVWNWLALSHEIGHQLSANVGELPAAPGALARRPWLQLVGLSVHDELVAHVMAYLMTLEPNLRPIWFKWLEEIFADLLSVLCIGPAAVYSMQHMFFHIPPLGWSRLLREPPHHLDWLLTDNDDEHPIPYLRVLLAIDALELLDKVQFQTDIDFLRKRWDAFFGQPPIHVTYHKTEIPVNKMRAIGKEVLKILLETKLYALGMKSKGLDDQRCLREVFFDVNTDKIHNAEQQLVKLLDASADDKQMHLDQLKQQLLSDRPEVRLEVRQVVAALQYVFERVTRSEGTTDEKDALLQTLSAAAIQIFREYGQEHVYSELNAKKKTYYRLE